MRKEQNFQWNHYTLGTCYYPEQWDQSLWKSDLQRMKSHGISVIRIAEFAWSKTEPREGEFTFVFFDEFLDLAEAEGMQVIFCTPTATPPAWLTEKYPEVLNCRKDGVKYRHGMRRHVNFNSPKYLELTGIIVEKLAEHYAKRPCIVGWQIDNEINCEVDEYYSESDSVAFRAFLKERYGTLEALNNAWGTVFWNQTYTDWEEIFVPRTAVHDFINPHQQMDFYRFISETVNRYFKLQSDILRKYIKPGDFITTNGMFNNLDNHRVEDTSLDVYTYDSYPNFAFCAGTDPLHSDTLNDRRKSWNLTEVRSVCPHFGIMEQQSGANGWVHTFFAPSPKPGQMMLWTMQSIAQGADFISYFRWRTATKGTEIYWHGLLDYNNKENRKTAELDRIWKRMQAIDEIAGADFQASFGMICDYDNTWDAQLDIWHGALNPKSAEEIFVASSLTHTPFDSVYLLDSTETEELLRYPVLIYPHPVILTEERAELLKDYVNNGGVLVIGARTDFKDPCGAVKMTSVPGMLSEITKTEVLDFSAVGPADGEVTMNWNGKILNAGAFNEIITPGEGAHVLARYDDNYYKGEAALTETSYGKGKILHFGGTFTRQTVTAVLDYLGVLNPEHGTFELPAECELVIRVKNGQKYAFVLNYQNKETEIMLKKTLLDMDTGSVVSGNQVLEPYGTRVYKYK